MNRTFIINKGQKPTEQLQEVREAQKHSIVFDEDSPELSPAMYKAFNQIKQVPCFNCEEQ